MADRQKDLAETPLMKQYGSIKARYPDALLLFRVGDFYETFGDDAVRTSAVLGIVLTRRANGAASYVELAGFPHHALDTYLPKLVKAGYRVAICDQLEDPKTAKTIVKRGVTELVTPGVSYHDKTLDQRQNNFLASVHLGEHCSGIAFLDVTTGEFLLAQGNTEYLDKLMQSFRPSEVVIRKNNREKFLELFGNRFYINTFEDWVFTADFGRDLLLRHFNVTSLKGFGVDNLDQGIIAAGACLHYLNETQHDRVAHISKVTRIEEDHYVWLDRFTIRNLELVQTVSEHAKTLLDVLDHTVTPMGSRLLRRWILLPLKNLAPVEERLEIVAFLAAHPTLIETLRKEFTLIGDLERLISKVAIGRVTPREMLHLKKALDTVEKVGNMIRETGHPSVVNLAGMLHDCHALRTRIGNDLDPEPPAMLSKGGVIREGVSEALDELRQIAFSGKDFLITIQQREIAGTGISSLKIGYTNVFGYYLEVTNTHRDKVPGHWQRKQTLVNAERYITPELKEYEEKILHAEERIQELENRIYNDLVLFVTGFIQQVQLNASVVSRLDVLTTFAVNALEFKYVRPQLTESLSLEIRNGRHPVIERQMKPGEDYVANDLYLDDKTQQIIILTGPNMSGKSALLRQTGLIALMAQMGSFVPAGAAILGLIDKIFVRVGASDNISSGESTFMVEMNETASILNNVSSRSLILLDEIGRGTSTYDGISIAWAIAEYLHENPVFRPKVLFATHYHELNEMAVLMNRIKNFHITVREIRNQIIFLRKLQPGGSEHSFGIHVARMAGMPAEVLDRARELLRQLETSHEAVELGRQSGQPREGSDMEDGGDRDAQRILSRRKVKAGKLSGHGPGDFQLSFIQLDDPLLLQIKEDILNTEINTLTPVEALMKLNEIKKLLEKK